MPHLQYSRFNMYINKQRSCFASLCCCLFPLCCSSLHVAAAPFPSPLFPSLLLLSPSLSSSSTFPQKRNQPISALGTSKCKSAENLNWRKSLRYLFWWYTVVYILQCSTRNFEISFTNKYFIEQVLFFCASVLFNYVKIFLLLFSPRILVKFLQYRAKIKSLNLF